MNNQNNFAVIKVKGSQYLVYENQEILVSHLTDKNIDPEVLLTFIGDKLKIGKPTLKNAEIKLDILGEEKGKKIDILKYKAKSRYRRRIGFRPKYTKIRIGKIG